MNCAPCLVLSSDLAVPVSDKQCWSRAESVYISPVESQQNIVADLLFDHDVGLGMEIVRFNFGASSTDENFIRSMRPFGAVPCVMLQDGTYDWTLVRTCCCPIHCVIVIALPTLTDCCFFHNC